MITINLKDEKRTVFTGPGMGDMKDRVKNVVVDGSNTIHIHANPDQLITSSFFEALLGGHFKTLGRHNSVGNLRFYGVSNASQKECHRAIMVSCR